MSKNKKHQKNSNDYRCIFCNALLYENTKKDSYGCPICIITYPGDTVRTATAFSMSHYSMLDDMSIDGTFFQLPVEDDRQDNDFKFWTNNDLLSGYGGTSS